MSAFTRKNIPYWNKNLTLRRCSRPFDFACASVLLSWLLSSSVVGHLIRTRIERQSLSTFIAFFRLGFVLFVLVILHFSYFCIFAIRRHGGVQSINKGDVQVNSKRALDTIVKYTRKAAVKTCNTSFDQSLNSFCGSIDKRFSEIRHNYAVVT